MTDKIKIKEPFVPDNINWELWSDELSVGGKTEHVEKRLAYIHGFEHAILTDSGTDAFRILLYSFLEMKEPERILMDDFTWESTKRVVKRCEVEHEFVDAEMGQFTRTAPPTAIPEKLYIPNFAFGNRGTPSQICDASYSYGDEKLPKGGWGCIMSFSPAKPITACEGGVILTNKNAVADWCRSERRYMSRPTELQASFLLEAIEQYDIDEETQHRRACAEYYDKNSPDWFELQKEAEFHNRGEIAFYHETPEDYSEDFVATRDRLDEVCQVRQRYCPTNMSNSNARDIYKRIFILPATSKDNMDTILEAMFDEAGN